MRGPRSGVSGEVPARAGQPGLGCSGGRRAQRSLGRGAPSRLCLEPGKARLSLKHQGHGSSSGYRSGGVAQGTQRGRGRAGGVVPEGSRGTLVPRVWGQSPPWGRGAEMWGDSCRGRGLPGHGAQTFPTKPIPPHPKVALLVLTSVEMAALRFLEKSRGIPQPPPQPLPSAPGLALSLTSPAPGRNSRLNMPSELPIIPVPGPAMPEPFPECPWSPGWGGLCECLSKQ